MARHGRLDLLFVLRLDLFDCRDGPRLVGSDVGPNGFAHLFGRDGRVAQVSDARCPPVSHFLFGWRLSSETRSVINKELKITLKIAFGTNIRTESMRSLPNSSLQMSLLLTWCLWPGGRGQCLPANRHVLSDPPIDSKLAKRVYSWRDVFWMFSLTSVQSVHSLHNVRHLCW